MLRSGVAPEITDEQARRFLERARQLTGLSVRDFYEAVTVMDDAEFADLAQGYRNAGEVLERVRLKVNKLGWSFDSLARLPAVEIRNGR